MVFSETILPTGKTLYKGLERVGCQVLLRDTRAFYLTDSVALAKNYGKVCKYRVKKTLRLFDLSHKNIDRLIKSKYPISEETKHLLRTALGRDDGRCPVSGRQAPFRNQKCRAPSQEHRHAPRSAPELQGAEQARL